VPVAALQTPRLPTVADFLQIASSCLLGTHCASFLTEHIDRVPDGFYSMYFFDMNACEPGYFCMQGIRQPCPTGFICPYPGMINPIMCENDESNNYNCHPQGLQYPHLCENGTLCGTALSPAIPAPPGAAMTVLHNDMVSSKVASRANMEISAPQRSLFVCERGDWCGLGRSDTEGSDALLCPTDTYCPRPGVVQPTVCDMNGTCTRDNCTGHAPFCPAGSCCVYVLLHVRVWCVWCVWCGVCVCRVVVVPVGLVCNGRPSPAS